MRDLQDVLGSWWSCELGRITWRELKVWRDLWSPSLSFGVVGAKEFHWSQVGTTATPSSAADALQYSNLCLGNTGLKVGHMGTEHWIWNRQLQATLSWAECWTVHTSVLWTVRTAHSTVQHLGQTPFRIKVFLRQSRVCKNNLTVQICPCSDFYFWWLVFPPLLENHSSLAQTSRLFPWPLLTSILLSF